MPSLGFSAWLCALVFVGLTNGSWASVLVFTLTCAVCVIVGVVVGAERPRPQMATLAEHAKARLDAERERDAALDALKAVDAAHQSEDPVEIAAAVDAARWVLSGGDYTGRLRAATQALENELAGASVDEHAKQAPGMVWHSDLDDVAMGGRLIAAMTEEVEVVYRDRRETPW
ncbi:hypothetical protein [Acrocarpospora sp. B8E8]|uniref:hypothetical protein n=1 Tax=Acrocarpospora sp. B8E8 TaxID=3153572 RepID=UPI00325DA95B